MSVSRDEIQRIAALAELKVDELTAEELQAQLSRILEYVAQLGELKDADGDGAEPRTVRLRADEPGRSDPLTRKPAEFAPEFKGDLFVGPKLAEPAGDGAP